ncbi:MAG: TolC family protein [Phycisphaerales bacterium]|nr:TolC family protein [Phycisphaerales bacterium]
MAYLTSELRSLCCLVLLICPGCATYRAAQRDVSRAYDWKRPRARLVQTPRNQVHIRQPKDLSQFILAALRQNPAIHAAISRVESEFERIPQVTSLDDPMLRLVTRPEPIQTAAGDIVFTLGVSQKLPLPAKLDLRGQVAAAELRDAIEQLNSRRLQVITDVERAYYRIYVADRSIEIADLNITLLEELIRVTETQYEVGKAEQQDLLRVQTELSDLQNAKTRFQGQRISAVAALNQLLDRPTTASVPTLARIEPSAVGVRVDELIALAEGHNPELGAFTHRIERDRKSIELAKLAYVPDLTLGVEWNRGVGRTPFTPRVNPQTGVRPPFNDASSEGDDNWALTIGLNLPIWAQRNEAARREARKRLQQTLHEKRATRNLIAFRIHDAWARAETLRDTIKLLEKTIIPQAQQTYEVSLPSYRGGTTDFLTVIENWRKLLSFELMYHREVASLETAFAELQREVGVSLALDHQPKEVRP